MYRFTIIIFFITLLIFSCKQKKENKNKIPLVLLNFNYKDTIPVVYDDSIEITFSYGFGECTGFCEKVFEIHSTAITRTDKQIISKNREYINAKRINTIPLNPNEYKTLINSFSNKFFALADKIGCPDCDDSGWAKITISIGNINKTVHYPYSQKIPEIELFQKNIMEITSSKKFPV